MDKYKEINKTLIWLCSLIIIAYFIFLPLNFQRSNPRIVSPSEENNLLKLEANPLLLFRDEKEVNEIITSTSTQTQQFPQALTPINIE